ncbi:hypothetical protein [Kitasatospora kifunensis]|uniref:Uncharacterized protein n=1 Tax=Kitasatospora kifunensis TaxID=58351 RepID=A0A7W7VTU8_KITKI|nr:hypothetical protein [Kitasatospora kifunensis]MBB4922153.1 hypothetical protein [Kitasatospora kifunensis]
MARGHGRILTSVWEDSDFLALTQEQQRLYLFLISQPNLNHAGLLPLTLRRWTRKAAGLSFAELDKHLAALDETRFIVVDDDTEELLVRSFVRNDGVWKQPKVMGAMVSGAMEISSRHLRQALLDEMDRIPLDELSDEPAKLRTGTGPSIRQQVAEHIETLRRAFRKPDGTPPERATPGGIESPSRTPSATPSDTHAEGHREPSTRAGAGAHDARAPLPLSPAPNPSPIQDVVATVVDIRPADARPAEPRRLDVEQACTLLADLIEANGSRRPAITQQWRDEARRMIDRDSIPLEDVLAAIRWSQADPFWRANILSMPKLRKQYDTLRLQAQRKGNPSSGLAATGTDARVAEHYALKAQMVALYNATETR